MLEQVSSTPFVDCLAGRIVSSGEVPVGRPSTTLLVAPDSIREG